MDSENVTSGLRRPWALATLAVLALNAGFLALQLLASTVPADHLRTRLVEAFDSGALATVNRLPFDTRIGWHQYNDCMILQMISNEDRLVGRTLGPLAYHRDGFADVCGTVRELAEGRLAGDELEVFRYTRYWHGYNALTALLLTGLSFDAVRQVFRAAAYLSLLLLALVGWRSAPPLREFALVLALFGTFFWGLPYFASSPSHGPGDAALILGFAGLLLLVARGGSPVPRGGSSGARGRPGAGFPVACAVFGGVLVYVEFLTGLLPAAAVLLLPFAYLAAESAGPGRGELRHRWRFAIGALLAFSLGVVLTTVIKQALALAAFGPEVIGAFRGNLEFWAAAPDPEAGNRLATTLAVLLGLVRQWGSILAYGSATGAKVLFGGTALAWCAALALAMKARNVEAASAFLACAAGASLLLVWVFVLPTHTRNHFFMARMLMAPLALGWIALLVQLPFGTRWELPPCREPRPQNSAH